MTKHLKTPPGSKPPSAAERREAKLEAALRLNLKKRKDQARERATGQTDPSSNQSGNER